jgi:hypothetical protein
MTDITSLLLILALEEPCLSTEPFETSPARPASILPAAPAATSRAEPLHAEHAATSHAEPAATSHAEPAVTSHAEPAATLRAEPSHAEPSHAEPLRAEPATTTSSAEPAAIHSAAMTVAVKNNMKETLWMQSKLQEELLLAAVASGAVKNQSVPRLIRYEPTPFDLFSHDDNWCLEFLRFTRRQICEMAVLLDIPFRFGDRYTASPVTALSLVLFRLSWPRRLKDLMSVFGHARGWLSRVFNATCQHIYRRFRSMLRWSKRNLSPQRLSEYCDKIKQHGEPSGQVWGFIDGTTKAICRPGPYSANQKDLFSAHKRTHAMKFLAVVTPDGLVSCLAGPYEGSKSDWGMWTDGLEKLLLKNARNPEGERVYVFGDKGFFMEEGIIGSYRRNAGIPLTIEELRFNSYMAKQRIAVEWGFAKIMQLFQFCNLRINLKYGLSPICPYYFTSALLTNCYTCYFGSQTTQAFDCPPPSIREYFGCVGEKVQELDDFLQELKDDSGI